MTTRYVRALVVSAGIAVLTNGAPLTQAPNQASLVTQTVAGVKFSTLPGFVIERMNPPEKGDSYVVITFDSLGRPVVSQSSAGNGSSDSARGSASRPWRPRGGSASSW